MIKPEPQIVMEHGRLQVDCKKCRLFEKQISKKPIEKFPVHHCPSCNTVVSEHNKFCSECGQKLDWRDEG